MLSTQRFHAAPFAHLYTSHKSAANMPFGRMGDHETLVHLRTELRPWTRHQPQRGAEETCGLRELEAEGVSIVYDDSEVSSGEELQVILKL
jgi:hypothetical protein